MSYPVYPGWTVEREIGKGSFGAVYEISRDMFGRVEKAALKCISIPENESEIRTLQTEGYSKADITDHFKNHLMDVVNEYSVMMELKGHPNVVYCDDLRHIQHDDGIGWDVFIKMELLTPLKQYVKSEYSEEDTVKLGKDLCSALTFCRGKNIIHRDIKPENIFVSESGTFKLGDFGVAKVTDKTAAGTKVGTFEYMAPEVYNNQPYSFAADVYAVGLVMYWMMNGKRTPFLPPVRIPTATQREESRKRRFSGEAIPAPLNGSAELQQIVLKACAYDPKERYESAEEMLKALTCYELGEPFEEATSATFGVWGKTPQQHAEAPANDGGNAEVKISVSQEEAPASEAPVGASGVSPYMAIAKESENSKSKLPIIVAAVVAVVAILGLLVVKLLPDRSEKPVVTPKATVPVAGPVHTHQWTEATYNDPQICVSCGETTGAAKTPSTAYGLRDVVSRATASSEYDGDNLGLHRVENLYDGKLQQNWTEDDPGSGVGEYAVFKLDDTYAVKKLTIYNGSHYNEGVYRENCRARAITLTFSDGTTERILLDDVYDEQVFVFDQYHYTNSIKLTIDEVYKGTKYLDTVIAELDFTVYRP